MMHFSGGRLDYGKFIQRMTIDAVGTDYIESKSLEGYDGLTIGRTFFHDCLSKRTYLSAKQFDKKILRLYEVILEKGCLLWDQGRDYRKSREELLVSLIEMMQEMPALPALLDLDSLVIVRSDDEGVAKSKRDELVGLLGLMLSCMPHEGDGVGVPVLNKALRLALPKRIDSFPIAGSRKAFVQLREAIRQHNERIGRLSGTYRLEKIVRGLLPGIVEEEHHSLFELDEQVSPLVQLIRSTWQASRWKNLMLVGGGGIGKTVAMLDAAKALSEKDTVAIYIPLHMLPFYIFPSRFIRTYIEETVLHGDSNLWLDLEALVSEKCVNNIPRLVLLLDGWNEIGEKRENERWFSNVLKEEIEAAIEPRSGIQVVIAGRARMDSGVSWCHSWAYSKVQCLNRDRILDYLVSDQVEVPNQDDPIWDVISNPLMLTLFTCCEKQHEHCSGNH